MAKGYYEEGVAETVVAYKEWVDKMESFTSLPRKVWEESGRNECPLP